MERLDLLRERIDEELKLEMQTMGLGQQGQEQLQDLYVRVAEGEKGIREGRKRRVKAAAASAAARSFASSAAP